MSPQSSLFAAIAVAGLAACAAPQAGPPGMVRICDDTGCTYRNPNDARPPPTDTSAEPQTDPDRYRGETLAELQAAASSGDTTANYKLGQAYLYGLGGAARNPEIAARNFAIAADRGHPWAQFRLAEMLLKGPGDTRDTPRALKLLFAAANNGQAQAADNLGMMYLSGTGLPKDSAEAAHWLTVAAENGVPEAQYNIGLLYYRGDGVPRQLYEALQWMRRAAQGGFLPAQVAVGRLYMTGLDTMGQDLQEARSWLTIAAGRGNADARRWLNEIDHAQAQEQQQNQALRLQSAQTATFLAAAIFAAAVAPPPVYILGY